MAFISEENPYSKTLAVLLVTLNCNS